MRAVGLRSARSLVIYPLHGNTDAVRFVGLEAREKCARILARLTLYWAEVGSCHPNVEIAAEWPARKAENASLENQRLLSHSHIPPPAAEARAISVLMTSGTSFAAAKSRIAVHRSAM